MEYMDEDSNLPPLRPNLWVWRDKLLFTILLIVGWAVLFWTGDIIVWSLQFWFAIFVFGVYSALNWGMLPSRPQQASVQIPAFSGYSGPLVPSVSAFSGFNGGDRPISHPTDSLPDVPPGRYIHYKGGLYEVLFTARHSESLERTVVYWSLDHGTTWCRPISEWHKPLTDGGARFRENG